MQPDDKIIVHELEPRDIKVWVCGDVHVGDECCMLKEWQSWLRTIENDENAYVIFLGDLMNCATKSSVSDVFSDLMNPRQQQDFLRGELYNLAHEGKILGMVMGNHEYRVGRESAIDPLYDVAVDLGIQNVYRKNFASIRIKMAKPNTNIHVMYDLLAFHGSSDLKVRNMANNISGWDALLTGHSHDPKETRPSQLCLTNKGTIYMRDVVQVTGCSWLKYGGYGARAMYLPKSQASPQCLHLKWPNSNNAKKKITVEW